MTSSRPAVSYTHLDVYKRQVLILTDRRLITKGYGKAFLNSLPSRTIKICSTADIVAELAQKMCIRDSLKTMREDQKFLLGLLGKTESSNCEPATEQVSVYGILERLRKRKGPSKGPFIINRSCLDCFT